jgi:hypothetical protein
MPPHTSPQEVLDRCLALIGLENVKFAGANMLLASLPMLTAGSSCAGSNFCTLRSTIHVSSGLILSEIAVKATTMAEKTMGIVCGSTGKAVRIVPDRARGKLQ